jgi:hypothetical protein
MVVLANRLELNFSASCHLGRVYLIGSPKTSYKIMKWWNLQKNRCPKCDHLLELIMKVQRANCPRCNFSISFQRMAEVVESQNVRKGEDQDKELEPEVAEDYYKMEL